MIHIHPGNSCYTTGDILVEGDLALMTERTFRDLKDYSLSVPTGVYPNKVWRRSDFWDKSPDKPWYLGRYEASSDPDEKKAGIYYCKWAPIQIVEGKTTSKQALDSLRNQWFMTLYTW